MEKVIQIIDETVRIWTRVFLRASHSIWLILSCSRNRVICWGHQDKNEIVPTANQESNDYFLFPSQFMSNMTAWKGTHGKGNCEAFSRRASRMGYQTVYFILSPFVGLTIWPVYWEPYLVLFPVSPFANKPNVSFAEWINHALRLFEGFAGSKF